MKLEELRLKREDILKIASRFHAENIRVFGSVARGEAKPDSDIDLLIHFTSGASLLDEAGLEIALNKLLGHKVDIIGDDVIRPEFKPFILKDALPL